jgi:AhpD family alkylhydroperoxidase
MELILDPKTQLLVALGAASAAKCQTCFATLYGAADKVGATEQEIRAAVAIATKVAGKAEQAMAAFIADTTGGGVPAGAADGCSCS